MKTVGVFANLAKERAPDVLALLANVAEKVGLEVMADVPTADLLGCEGVDSVEELFLRVDAVIALGGDGTMLRVARSLAGHDKPIMGVNIGALGFLTSIAEEELECAMGCLARDEFEVDATAVAEAIVERDGTELARYRALNEVVVSRGVSMRVATLDLAIDGEALTSYVCDGVIVSTPVGSTGHSLSAGGPILVPATPAFVVTPICAHTLSSRPLVVPDRSEIVITISGAADDLVLSVDGQDGQPLSVADRVSVRRSKEDVKLIHLPGHSYFSVLRQKLGWRGSSV